jgi:hypothetical protein
MVPSGLITDMAGALLVVVFAVFNLEKPTLLIFSVIESPSRTLVESLLIKLLT